MYIRVALSLFVKVSRGKQMSKKRQRQEEEGIVKAAPSGGRQKLFNQRKTVKPEQ